MQLNCLSPCLSEKKIDKAVLALILILFISAVFVFGKAHKHEVKWLKWCAGIAAVAMAVLGFVFIL